MPTPTRRTGDRYLSEQRGGFHESLRGAGGDGAAGG